MFLISQGRAGPNLPRLRARFGRSAARQTPRGTRIRQRTAPHSGPGFGPGRRPNSKAYCVFCMKLLNQSSRSRKHQRAVQLVVTNPKVQIVNSAEAIEINACIVNSKASRFVFVIINILRMITPATERRGSRQLRQL